MALFGLLGYPLGHSFSKRYFTQKFATEGLKNYTYQNFEIDNIDKVIDVFRSPDLRGLNVTIPYKEEVIPFLDELHEDANRIGAVNVIKFARDGRKIGHNSDYYGFKQSLINFLDSRKIDQALILGTGGAGKAIKAALEDLQINFSFVSRTPDSQQFTYEQIKSNPELLKSHQLLINTTPLGTFPNVEDKPDIPYKELTSDHFLYDVVYNPSITAFMKAGKEQGANIKNGLEMLELQAEKSWEIWNSA